jgi:hypothetical protein
MIGAGRNDDGDVANIALQEVYSGNPQDDTPENITVTGLSRRSATWSVMSEGWNPDFSVPPINGEYIPYSIEEVLTIEFNEIETRD